jgi:hypothetical protein
VSESKITMTIGGEVIPIEKWQLGIAGRFMSSVSFGPGSKTWTMPLDPPALRFGDVLRYPAADDPDTKWLFTFLDYGPDGGCEVLVLKAPAEDDQWETGTIVYAGSHELELAE